MATLAERTRPPLPPRRLHRRIPRPSASLVVMGSGGETARETVGLRSIARGERVGVVQVRLYRPFPAAGAARGAARDRAHASPCSTGRRSRARSASRSSSTWSRRWRRRRRRRAARHADDHRRPLRPLLEGVHAGDGRRRVRRARRASGRGAGSRSGSTTTSPGRASPTTATLDIEPPDTVRAVFFGLGSDGTVGANKNTIKILGAERACTPRATSSTTRRSRARRPSRTCASGRSRSAPPTSSSRRASSAATSSACSSASTCSAAAADGATLLLNSPRPADAGLGRALPAGPGADPGQANRALRHRRRPDRPRGGPCRAGSTSSCRPASSPSRGVLPREQAIERIKAVDRQDLRPARRRGRRAKPGGRRPRARRPAPGRGAGVA